MAGQMLYGRLQRLREAAKAMKATKAMKVMKAMKETQVQRAGVQLVMEGAQGNQEGQ
jgi:hypothetical protein